MKDKDKDILREEEEEEDHHHHQTRIPQIIQAIAQAELKFLKTQKTTPLINKRVFRFGNFRKKFLQPEVSRPNGLNVVVFGNGQTDKQTHKRTLQLID